MTPIKKSENVPISQLCTFQHEGVVSVVYDAFDVQALSQFVRDGHSFIVLGKGSNSIINPDGDFSAILRLSPSMFSTSYSDGILQVSAGVSVASLMSLSRKFECSGLEFAAGVPATVGGMVAMNFGCWGHEIKDYIRRVYVMNEHGDCDWISASDCEFSYRSSIFQTKPWIVLMAEFDVIPGNEADIKALIMSNINTRLEKQPLRSKTFGSTFKNPPGQYAGALIEKVGLRGQGNAHVCWSEQHANFLVNKGDATFSDITDCLDMTVKKVYDNCGVQLDLEVKIIS